MRLSLKVNCAVRLNRLTTVPGLTKDVPNIVGLIKLQDIGKMITGLRTRKIETFWATHLNGVYPVFFFFLQNRILSHFQFA